jgi:hypothetical protein
MSSVAFAIPLRAQIEFSVTIATENAVLAGEAAQRADLDVG